MYLDDLPIWGIVGEMEEKEFYIWTHKKFEIGYNGDQIIDVNLTSEGKTKLKLGEEIAFSYEVTWKKSSLKFEVRLMMRMRKTLLLFLHNFQDRFDKYLDPNFFQHRIHWFSIFNSFMMVIFLVKGRRQKKNCIFSDNVPIRFTPPPFTLN